MSRVAWVAVALLCTCTAVAGSERTLWSALQQLARVHRVTIVLEDDAASARSRPAPIASAADGATLAASLDHLLAPGALQWHRGADGTIRISAAVDATLSLDPLDIEAERIPASDGPADPLLTLDASPSTVAVDHWTRTELAAQSLWSLDNLLRRAPNVSGSGRSLAIRGIERGAVGLATSHVYIDGIPLAGSKLRQTLLPTWIDAVEFRRGPRTALDPVGGLAGAIAISTGIPMPIDEAAAEFAGGPDLAQAAARLQRVLPGGLSARIQAGTRHEASRITLASGATPPDGRNELVSGRLTFEPDRLPQLRADLALLASSGEPALDLVQPAAGAAANERFSRISHEAFPPRVGTHGHGAHLAVEWKADATQTLRLAVLDSRANRTATRPTTIADERVVEREHDALSALRLGWQWSPSRRWTLAAGSDHVRRRAGQQDALRSPLSAFFPPAGDVRVIPAGATRLFAVTATDRSTEHSMFVDVDYAGTRWHGSLGLRRLRTDRSSERDVSLGVEQTACRLQIGPRSVPCEVEFPPAHSAEQLPAQAAEWVPQAELGWSPSEDRHFGMLIRRGLLPGGARVNPADGSIVTYRPERSDTIDLEWSERRGRLEMKVDLFFNRWNDRQVRVALAGRESYLIRNAGEARAHGGELLLRWHAGRQWFAWAGIGYLDTRFRRFALPRPGGESELAGNRFPGAPPWTATLGVVRRYGRWELTTSVWGSAAAFSDATNDVLGKRPGHVIADLRLSRAFGSDGMLWFAVDNLTDAESLVDVHVAGLTPVVRDYVPGASREWRLGVRWHW